MFEVFTVATEDIACGDAVLYDPSTGHVSKGTQHG